MLLWASACFAVSLGVGVFGGVAMPTGKMATWEIPDVLPNQPGYSPFTGSDMALSPKFGVKAIIGFGRGWEAEAAVAYHLGHGVKDWQENDFLEEPKSTLIPITVGANYRFNFGKLGLYAGAGGGYYLEKFKGGVWWNAAFREPEYFTTDVSLNGPEGRRMVERRLPRAGILHDRRFAQRPGPLLRRRRNLRVRPIRARR
jgi:hypothetical protein